LLGGSVRSRSGASKPVAGIYEGEMLECMRRLGFEPRAEGGSYASLMAFCRDMGHMGDFMVMVSGHFIAVGSGLICDTYTQTPITFEQYFDPNPDHNKHHKYFKPRWRVVKWWKF
jgi:hypothetical protein